MKADRPSRTAMVVAMSQALVGACPATRGLVDPAVVAFARRALERSGRGRFVTGLRHPWFRKLVGGWEAALVPGLAVHHVLRKRAIEDIVRRDLRDGAARVIQVGAGFDSLAFRLHGAFPDAEFVELDHPATQAVKRGVINSLGGAGPNLTLRPVDLGGCGEGHWPVDPRRRTVVILEGVLMYLSAGAVQRLLGCIRGDLAPGSRLLFTFMEAPRFGRQSPLVGWWLRMAGEPFRWTLPPAGLRSFLRETGWEPHRFYTIRETTAKPLAGSLPRMATGEWLCEAEPLGVPMARPLESETRTPDRSGGVGGELSGVHASACEGVGGIAPVLPGGRRGVEICLSSAAG